MGLGVEGLGYGVHCLLDRRFGVWGDCFLGDLGIRCTCENHERVTPSRREAGRRQRQRGQESGWVFGVRGLGSGVWGLGLGV